MTDKVWSDRQTVIYNTQDEMVANMGSGQQTVLVEACPGSGKTTTLVEVSANHTPGLSTIFLAFNRDIVTEMSSRMPGKKAATCHSFALGVCGKTFGSVKVDDGKERMILQRFLDKWNWGHLYHPILQLTGFVKKTLLEDWSNEALQELADYYSVDLNSEASMIFDMTRKVLEASEEEYRTVSFDDMLWLLYRYNAAIPKYDFIGQDETQDASNAQIALVRGAMHDNSIWMGVGDPFQSINGFSGAGVNSMQILREQMKAKVLPLDITYRCPKAVVQLVNQGFPHIPFIARPGAIEGQVAYQNFSKITFQVGDMILCRTNAPLVRPCFSLIRRGIKAIIKGKKIGEGLQSIIKKMKANDMHSLMSRLADYRDEETYKLRLAHKDIQADALDDKVETIFALADGCSSVQDLLQKCYDIFDDKNGAVTFSSAHRSKGLEAENVYILKPELMPHPMAKLDWEKQQEDNLRYVSYTRSKRTLTFVEGL